MENTSRTLELASLSEQKHLPKEFSKSAFMVGKEDHGGCLSERAAEWGPPQQQQQGAFWPVSDWRVVFISDRGSSIFRAMLWSLQSFASPWDGLFLRVRKHQEAKFPPPGSWLAVTLFYDEIHGPQPTETRLCLLRGWTLFQCSEGLWLERFWHVKVMDFTVWCWGESKKSLFSRYFSNSILHSSIN